jgi:hypothetical protein
MEPAASLPGLDLAQQVLELNLDEIARAVLADPSALYRWRQGQTPTAIYRSRLTRLDELAREIQDTFRPEIIADWLRRPIPAFGGRTPREMILAGRSETVLGALMALNRGFGG